MGVGDVDGDRLGPAGVADADAARDDDLPDVALPEGDWGVGATDAVRVRDGVGAADSAADRVVDGDGGRGVPVVDGGADGNAVLEADLVGDGHTVADVRGGYAATRTSHRRAMHGRVIRLLHTHHAHARETQNCKRNPTATVPRMQLYSKSTTGSVVSDGGTVPMR